MEPIHFESLYPDTARFKEIAEILMAIKEGHSCQLIGIPGVGRGTILEFLAYNRSLRIKHLGDQQNQYHFVLANFAEVKNRPLLDVIKFLFLELVSSLHQRHREEEFAVTDHIFKESLSYNDGLVLFQGFKKAIDFLTNEKQLIVVLLLERFETYLPMLTSEFFTDLRSIHGKAKYKFSVVFSLERPLEEIVEPTLFADFYEFFTDHTVYVELFDQVIFQFRKTYLEKLTKTSLSPKIIKHILTLTGGHGKLTKLCLEFALSHKEPLREEILLQQKAIYGGLLEIWQCFTPLEQKQLKDRVIKNIYGENAFLTSVHILADNVLTIPLLAAFIHTQTSLATPTLLYDTTTNTITKGGSVISDDLTGSEFRLLQCLLQHPNQIIDKEEIITTVWKNSASTAGVTDQALDQLIFRVRKKIEEDPNNPHYIHTVKGRGFKYNQ